MGVQTGRLRGKGMNGGEGNVLIRPEKNFQNENGSFTPRAETSCLSSFFVPGALLAVAGGPHPSDPGGLSSNDVGDIMQLLL